MKKLIGSEKVRIYGKTVNTWSCTVIRNGHEREVTTQYEIAYKDYRVSDGSLVATGTEDFSPERWRKSTTFRGIWTWDGKSYNKGGMRKFDYVDHWHIRKDETSLVKIFVQNKYHAEVAQVRSTGL